MVVADADKREVSAGILNVGVMDMRPVHHAIAVESGRDVEVVDLARIGHPAEVVDGAVVAMAHLVRIFHHLVDEVAEMQDEAQSLVGGCALVLPDHPPIRVLRPFVDALAGDEGKAYRARIVQARGGDGATDPAARAVRIGEAVPIDVARLQTADQHASGPIGGLRHLHPGRGDHAGKGRVLRYLDMEKGLRPSIVIGPARP